MSPAKDIPLLSPSKITGWLECNHYLTLKNEAFRGDIAQIGNEGENDGAPKSFPDLLRKKGDLHEQKCLADYKEKFGDSVYEVEGQRKEQGESFQAWVERVGNPMEHGYDVIFQMPFIHDGIRGIADFLVKTEYEGQEFYEPVDSKLARKGAKSGHLLQLLFYAEAVEAITGKRPKKAYVALGSGGPPEEFEVADYWWYWQRLKSRLKNLMESESDIHTKPDKCSFCGICEFWEKCEKDLRRDDSLAFISGCNRSYRTELSETGIETLTGLALLPGEKLEDLLSENNDGGTHSVTQSNDEKLPTIFLDEKMEKDFNSAVKNISDEHIQDVLAKWNGKLPGINPRQLVKLWRQARLQFMARYADPTFHFFAQEEMTEKMLGKASWQRGDCILHLPEMNDHDIYLDFEGHPFWKVEKGLIFLFGYLFKEGGSWHYKALWAHDKEEEKSQARELVNFFYERHQENPNMRVYHYNHTERVLLADLIDSEDSNPTPNVLDILKYAFSEDVSDRRNLDELIENGVFVDLLAIVRNSLQAGVESYSLKKMEKLAGFHRNQNKTDKEDASVGQSQIKKEWESPELEEVIVGGAGAVLAYEYYANADLYDIPKSDEFLKAIEHYNKDDVEATRELHEWLLKKRRENPVLPDDSLPIPEEELVEDDDGDTKKAELRRRIRDAQDRIGQKFSESSDVDLKGKFSLLYCLLDYWKKESLKSFQDQKVRLEATENEQKKNVSTIAGLLPIGLEDRIGKKGNVLGMPAQRYKFSPQIVDGSKFKPGKRVMFLRENEFNWLGIHEFDQIKGEISFIWDLEKDLEAHEIRSVTAADSVSDDPKPETMCTIAEDLIEDPKLNTVTKSLLFREKPSPRRTFDSELEQLKEAVSSLENSYLAIQGPPGTGKTWTGARLIQHLVTVEKKRVGITSQSWYAIDHLLRETMELINRGEESQNPKVVRIMTSNKVPEENRITGVEYPASKPVNFFADCDLVAGTAWHWANKKILEEDKVDYLVIDEAGQFSLADALVSSMGARNLILLGDPQQLPQVTQAKHLCGAGASVLEHVIGNSPVIGSEYGAFLDTTYRLRPEILQFISEQFYKSELRTDGDRCEKREVEKGSGLFWISVSHDGDCVNESQEEAEKVSQIIRELIGTKWVDVKGDKNEPVEKELTIDDFMVVAPYNAQVNLIQKTLERSEYLRDKIDNFKIREIVGTVDRFQGKEAPVVIYSLTTSHEDLMQAGRKGDFLFSPNRFNVAVSRAQCLTFVLSTEEIIDSSARSISEMKDINNFCRYVDDLSDMWPPTILI
tara:strand:- start:85 stop:3957 length:3873 start_codon:yes stop_codon:yes gene_type:complete